MEDPQEGTILIRLGMAIFCALVSVGIFYVFFRIGRKLWRSVQNVFGRTTGQRLIGFGIVSLFFPRAVIGLLNLLISAVLTLTVLTPVELLLSTNLGSGNPPRALILERAAEVIARNLAVVAHSFLGQAQPLGKPELPLLGASSLDLGDLLALVILWALLGLLLQAGQGPEGTSRIASFYKALSPASRKNLLLATVLLLGGFLSLAAIIAIPFLGEGTPEDVPDSASLKAQLDTLSLQEKDLPQVPEDPLAPVDQLLQSKPSLPEDQLVRLSDTVAKQRTLWSQVSQGLEGLRSRVMQFQEQAKEKALSKYEHSTLSRLGSRESLQHYERLISWYEETQRALARLLSSCEPGSAYVHGQWKQWSAEVTQRVQAGGDISNLLRDPFLPDEATLAIASCELGNWQPAPTPNRPSIGESLGPIGLIVRWLLRTESMPLALISGMLGFGLFGSAISRFVRTHLDQGKGEEALVPDVGRIVLTGASAAVVVFLSVQGGLAAFSGTKDAPEPNPYTLLLTCFIAAIFSETIWGWARQRLQQSFGKGSPGDGSNGQSQSEAASRSRPPVTPEQVASQQGSEPTLPAATPGKEIPRQGSGPEPQPPAQ